MVVILTVDGVSRYGGSKFRCCCIVILTVSIEVNLMEMCGLYGLFVGHGGITTVYVVDVALVSATGK